jgi:hypothetical protein
VLTKFLPDLKLVLRFVIVLLTAELLLKFVVLLIACAEYAWADHNGHCRTLLFALLVAGSDLLDGVLFGKPSVFDTIIEKIKGK